VGRLPKSTPQHRIDVALLRTFGEIKFQEAAFGTPVGNYPFGISVKQQLQDFFG
jgi:hypothetical protein